MFGGGVWYQNTCKHHINGENTKKISWNSKINKIHFELVLIGYDGSHDHATLEYSNTPAIA